MTKRIHFFLPLCAALLLAEPADFVMESTHTNVEYTLGDVLHTVKGTFKLKRASFGFDPQSGQASGELVVDATSGNSGSKVRDSRMNADILESGKYPEIAFRPDRVEGDVAPEGKS